MWVLKLTLKYIEGILFGDFCKKYNVSFEGYPNSFEIFENNVKCLISGKLVGNNSDIDSFILNIKKDKRFLNLEYNNNFLVIQVFQNINAKLLFDSEILYLKPVICNLKGEYIFEVATWKREKFNNILTEFENLNLEFNVEFMKQMKINNIDYISVNPNLTERQQFCFMLAKKNGYYDFPRKITLKELSKISKLSYTTFHFHLRKAERKLIPTL